MCFPWGAALAPEQRQAHYCQWVRNDTAFPLCLLLCYTSALPTAWLVFGWTTVFQVVTCARTTGEFWAMTLDERRRVAATARRHFPGKVTVNVSACALGDVHTLLEHCVAESEVLEMSCSRSWWQCMHLICQPLAATVLFHAAHLVLMLQQKGSLLRQLQHTWLLFA